MWKLPAFLLFITADVLGYLWLHGIVFTPEFYSMMLVVVPFLTAIVSGLTQIHKLTNSRLTEVVNKLQQSESDNKNLLQAVNDWKTKAEATRADTADAHAGRAEQRLINAEAKLAENGNEQHVPISVKIADPTIVLDTKGKPHADDPAFPSSTPAKAD